MGGEGAYRKRAARPAARARAQRRAHQGLRQRDERPLGISAPRRPHDGDGRSLPGAQARRAQREEPRLLGEREGVALHRGQALRLVPRLSGRRPLADVGTPELPLERLRFRGEREGGHRGRLADSLQRTRAVVRPCRKACGDFRFARRTGATARRRIPAGHAAQLRRGIGRRPVEECLRRQAPDDHRARRERDAGARRTLGMPIPQRVLAGLSLRRLFQHAVVHAAGGGEDRQAHAEAVVDRDRSPARQEAQARHRRARARRRQRADASTTRRRSFFCAHRRSTRHGC